MDADRFRRLARALIPRRSGPHPPATDRPLTPRAGAVAHLGTTVLLLVTLAVGAMAVRPRAIDSEDGSAAPPALIRAFRAAPDGAVAEPLVEAVFSEGELPGCGGEAIFYRLSLPPGAGLPYLVGPVAGANPLDRKVSTAGVGAEAVLSGAYAVRVAAPIQIHRGSAEKEDVAAGTEVVLGPGDAAVYPDYAAPAEVRSGRDGPAMVAGVAIVEVDCSAPAPPALPAGVEGKVFSRLPWELAALPPGAIRVVLWRLALPAGGSAGPYEATGLEALWVERGAITRGVLRPGETAPRGKPRSLPAGETAPLAAPVPGQRLVVAATGDGPAELLALTVESVAVGPTTLES